MDRSEVSARGSDFLEILKDHASYEDASPILRYLRGFRTIWCTREEPRMRIWFNLTRERGAGARDEALPNSHSGQNRV